MRLSLFSAYFATGAVPATRCPPPASTCRAGIQPIFLSLIGALIGKTYPLVQGCTLYVVAISGVDIQPPISSVTDQTAADDSA